jgi:hypothetical protein
MDSLKDSVNNVINTDTLSGQILFVLAVLLGIYIVIRIIFMLMTLIYSPGSSEVTLLNGKIAGDQIKEFSQNPNDDADCTGRKCAKPLLLSNNALTGIEYTWSFWLNINPELSWFTDNFTAYNITDCLNGINNGVDQTYNCSSGGSKKAIHIFHKGSQAMEEKVGDNHLINDIKLHNNAPGVYLSVIDHIASHTYVNDISDNGGVQSNNSIVLLIYMDTIEGPSARRSPIVVPNIPTQKWCNVTLVAKQSTLYIYINGVLKKLHTYDNVFKLNYDSVHIGSSVNYGELSSLTYWNRAINTHEINSILSNGPNLNTVESRSYADELPRYLDMSWYNN